MPAALGISWGPVDEPLPPMTLPAGAEPVELAV